MNNIIAEIINLFQNEKVGEIFANCEGSLGLINLEIEKSLTFREIDQVLHDLNPKLINDFLERNQLRYPYACDFIENFQSKLETLKIIYENAGDKAYVRDLYMNNAQEILKMYPRNDIKQSLLDFKKHYYESYERIIDTSYYSSQEFFTRPLEYLAS